MTDIRNREVASVLERIADLLEMEGGNRYRVRAYREAARRIEDLREGVETLVAEGRLRELPGIGSSIASTVQEYLETGRSTRLRRLEREVAPGLSEILKVPGIGPRKAELIYRQLGLRSVEGLARAAREHRLSELPGIGEKTEAKLLSAVERLRLRTRRILLGVALPAANAFVSLLQTSTGEGRISPVGGVRRGVETVGDIDILVASEAPQAVLDAVSTMAVVKEILDRSPSSISVLTEDDLPIIVHVAPPQDWGAALQFLTGSESHNVALRDVASTRGLELGEQGVFDTRTGLRLGGEEEADVYHLLGMEVPPPEIRENMGEIDAALRHQLPTLIAESDLRGDLHVHTDWSDGVDSLESMVEATIARGYEYVAITDHSHGLTIAHGLSPERVREQRRIIDRLNGRYAPFRILHGTECNILNDGSLDYDDDVLRQFDVVTAAVHGGFGQSRRKITERIVRALRNPYVDVLSHPTGRLIGRRPGYDVDLEEVIRVAARTGTALEIDSQPDRLDLNDVWSRRAKQLGARLTIDSDAHATHHLLNVRYGILTARRGWIEKQNVLNTLSLHALLKLLHRHRRAA